MTAQLGFVRHAASWSAPPKADMLIGAWESRRRAASALPAPETGRPGSAGRPATSRRGGCATPRQARASSTMLNGVCAATRTLVKPAAASTSVSAAGPAWAPRAWAPSWASALGVHRNVEPA